MNENKSLTRRTLRGISWMMSATIVNVLLQIVFLAILARLITPSEYGVMGAAMIIVGFLSLLTQFGVRQALVQCPDLSDDHARVGFTLSLFVGGSCTLVAFALAPLMAVYFKIPLLVQVLRVLAPVYLIQGCSVVAEALMQRDMKFSHLAVQDVAAYLLGYGCVGLTLAMAGYGVWALVHAYLAQMTIRAIILLYAQPHRKALCWKTNAVRELLTYGGGMTLSSVFNKMANLGDNFIVGKFLGVNALGFYQRAYDLMKAPAKMLGVSLEKVLFPAFSSIQYEQSRLQRAYQRSLVLVALLLMPVSAAFYVLSPEIILLLLGSDWSATERLFQILGLGLFFRLGYKINGSLARATGKVYRLAAFQAVYALGVLSGALIGQLYGVDGVAWGVLAALTMHYILMSGLGMRITDLSIVRFVTAHLPGLVLGGGVYLLVTILAEYSRVKYHNAAITLAICSFCIVFLFFVLISFVYCFGPLRAHFDKSS